MRRFIHCCALVIILALALVAVAQVPMASAQVGPSEATLDAIFADLSQRTGRTVTWRRGLLGRWEFQEIISSNDNLGCEAPGQAAPGVTRAWQVMVYLDGIGSYDYRTTLSGSVILLCSGTGVGAPGVIAVTPAPAGPTPAPLPIGPAPSTEPTMYQAPVIAFIGGTGDVQITSLGINSGPTFITGDALGQLDSETYAFTAERNYRHLQWSPDGSRLAFQDDGNLYVAASGQEPIQVASGIVGYISSAWSPDGAEIAYVVDTRQAAPTDPQVLIYQVQAVPAGGGQPRVAGTITQRGGCGGGGYGAAEGLYMRETGFMGNAQPLYWTNRGFIHMNDCMGVGLVLTDPSGVRLWERPGLARASLSPDGTRLAAIQMAQQAGGPLAPAGLLTVDLATGAMTPIQTQGTPDQTGWTGDGGAILYSTRTPLPGPRAGAGDFTLELWSVPAGSGSSTQLYAGEGYAIGHIGAAPAVAAVAFSLIPSDVALYLGVQNNAPRQTLLAAAPQARLVIASLTPGVVGYPYIFDASGGLPAISRAATFTAIPAAVQAPAIPTGDNPLGLRIGGQARVTATINVNVRTEPALAPGNVLSLLRPGDIITILNGPRFADNLRWWQIRRDADGTVGWVVDQIIDAQGRTSNNLAPLD